MKLNRWKGAKRVYEIIKKLKVDAPIATNVWKALHGGESVEDLAKALMNLPMHDEHYGIPGGDSS